MSIFNSSTVVAARRQVVSGLTVAALTLATPEALAEVNSNTADLNLVGFQLFDADASEHAARSVDSAAPGYRTPRFPEFAAGKEKRSGWITSIHLNMAATTQGANLAPRLRFESEDQHVEITARRHSVSVAWHKTLH